MRLFESILDDPEVSSSAMSVADAASRDEYSYELPSDENYRNIIILANGHESYEELINDPELLEQRFERLQETVQMFRHVRHHSDF